jgi:hypothetical protein
MLSRKEFFKDLLWRGFRAASDLAGANETHFPENDGSRPCFDLPATELSPSLLAIEAQCRGIDLQADSAGELRREIYQELAQSRPPFNPPSPSLSNKSPLTPLCQRGVRGDLDDDLPKRQDPQPNLIAKGG